MTTRRHLLLGVLVLLASGLGAAPAAEARKGKGPILEVTYYYLPG